MGAAEITIYVPAPGDPATAAIAKGSAIIGQPSPDGVEVKVYYEGATFGQTEMETLVDRARHAASRMLASYPTSAMRIVPKEALVAVGVFDRGRILLTDAGAEQALADWLGVPRLDRAELGGGVPNPTFAQATAIAEAISSFEADGDVVLQGWQMIDGAEFHEGDPAPADRLYVEFLCLDPHHRIDELQHRPTRTVHVYGTTGNLLECKEEEG